MAEKRRDNKGRVLRAGESQRPDGKYEYKYADSNGERHSVYSWKLQKLLGFLNSFTCFNLYSSEI